MDRDECRELEDDATRLQWVKKYTAIRRTRLCGWVSSFHPQQLACQTVGADSTFDKRGSYNIVCQVRFDATGETWAVRFPQAWTDAVSDEKLEAEMAAINIVRSQTNIPIPEIKAWGLACKNELGLGPYMISTWVEGICLADILTQGNSSSQGRMIHEDIPSATIEHLWRQIARFMLQLSRISFDRIGSCTATPRRPLTIKSHYMQESGIPIGCSPSTTFTSSADYFDNIARHDIQHLQDQLNSVDDEEDARQKYINWHVLRLLVPRFVSTSHNNGPFSLICDDFGPMNMIVNNKDDFQIVAVIDWEWSYAGPRELFWSPPLWLLGQHPACWVDGVDNSHLLRYLDHLEIFIAIVQEEEGRAPRVPGGDLPSVLLRKRQQDGSMWFHQVMQEAYNGPNQVPFSRLRASVPDFEKLAAIVPQHDTEAFVRLKLGHLEQYRKRLSEAKEKYRTLFQGMSM